MTSSGTEADTVIRPIDVQPLEPATFEPFGQVISASEDGVPFGHEDARLELSKGTPRFYIMRLHGKGMRFRQITRHRDVTQCLASVGGLSWLIAVAPPFHLDDPEAQPKPDDIRAFEVPGTVAIKLHRGTWHAGPFFAEPEMSFFNLELADTNLVDHHNCHLDRRYGTVFEFRRS